MPARSKIDEEVAAFLRGDPALHRAVRAAVQSVVRSFRFSGRGATDDLVQETVCRLFLNLSIGAFRGEASLQIYAERIARYVCLEQMRRRRFAADIDPAALSAPAPTGNPEAALLRAENRRRHLEVLAALSPESRQLLRLIFVEELSYAEVAERLGISEAAVKLRVHRCRLTLREDETPPVGPAEPRESPSRWRRFERAEE
jgi:RNA polymerase sigma-70 factor (ECF subfamily)